MLKGRSRAKGARGAVREKGMPQSFPRDAVWNQVSSPELIALLTWAFGWGIRMAFPRQDLNHDLLATALVLGVEGRRHPPVTDKVWNAFLVIVGWWREINLFGRWRGKKELMPTPDYQKFFGAEPGDV